MTQHYLRLNSLFQEIPCPACQSGKPAIEWRRAMNFSTNLVRLFCPRCRMEIGKLPFQRWNLLHKKALGEIRP